MGKLWRRAAVCAACLAFLGGGLPAHAQQEPLPAAAGGILPEQGQLPLHWAGNDGLEYSFEITQPGTYAVGVSYRAFESRSDFIEFDLQVGHAEGVLSLSGVTLERPLLVGAALQDAQGNEIWGAYTPADFSNYKLLGRAGAANGPWLAELPAGRVTLTLKGKRTDLELERLELVPWQPAAPYAGEKSGFAAARQPITVQAEAVCAVSASTLGAQYDRTGPGVQPADPGRLVLNIAGGENWCQAGQWMEWRVQVPENGVYALRIKGRQNIKGGLSSNRRLYVDGAVPCAEAEDIVFPYSQDWQLVTLAQAGGQEVLLPLKAGEHTLRLEVVPGPLAGAVEQLRGAMSGLNEAYRQIVMVTGVNPDKNRDYALDELIPGLMEALHAGQQDLLEQKSALEQLSGQRQGDELTTLNTLCQQLGSFIQQPDTIPLRLANYKSNLDNMAVWLNTLTQQPLELDYLLLDVPGAERTVEKAGFLQNAAFSLKGLWYSFFHDYDTVSDASEPAQIEAWVGMGRDQLQIAQQLVNERFTPETGITVKLNAAQAGAMNQQGITEAIMAGRGPDVMLYAASTEPANLAMRGALLALDGLPGFDALKAQCQGESFVPYEYDGATYGVPFTQQFPMLFYRTDILQELGLSVPGTWEELYGAIPVIQRKNMQVGVPSSDQTFATLLFQQGGGYYAADRRSTALKDNRAVETFTRYTRLFSDYGLPLSYDFYNRFCSGEMPLAIADYTEYNRLVVAAPEIAGLWAMAPVPGTLQPDGTLDRQVLSGGGWGGYILAGTARPEEAWSFLRWFAGADTQAEFGRRSEAVQGAAGRYPAANTGALEKLPWLADELALLEQQRAAVRENPQPPGSYYTQRNLNNAFRQVVLNGENPREMLGRYMDEVDRELERKWAEYGAEKSPGKGNGG